VPRAVLDANVLASALIRPEGPPGEIVRRFFRDRAFDLVLSPAILDEVGRCLGYPRVRTRIRLSDDEIELWVAGLALAAEVVPDRKGPVRVAEDPDDDKYLAAALEARAAFVVSGDRHLLAVREHEGTWIVRPRTFLAFIGS
jgi:putative PIN family toxin of toxin-antitoxin system